VYADEIMSYQTLNTKAYHRQREIRNQDRSRNIENLLIQISDGSAASIAQESRQVLKDSPRAAYRAIKAARIRQFRQKVEDFASAAKHSVPSAQQEQENRQSAARRLHADVKHAQSVVGVGIFEAFVSRQTVLFQSLVHNTFTFFRIVQTHPQGFDTKVSGPTVTTALLPRDAETLTQSDSITGSLYNMAVTTPMWLVSATAPMQYRPENADTTGGGGGWLKMITYRGLYLASLLLVALFSIVLLAFTGASISRLSALELAGVERVPLLEVFRFAACRLWTFIKAILTPLLIILVVGLLIAGLSLIGAVPYIGELILGVFFIALLLIAFVMMLLTLGIIGGINLLFPTIAVEGSDAFDAMSRSFAYVYARPWRLLFYSLVSLAYGAVTYLFVSFATYLIFLIAHTFVGWGIFFAQGQLSGVSKLDTLWPFPKGDINWYAMNWSEAIGAGFMQFWIYLFLFAIVGYIISYYFSVQTILYLLLRRSVDGQSTTEVFQEPAQSA
ncbi:MAG: hypothetical protein FWD53_12985, partial [Phycisphaerales bacterium]|nr:hypothetical protein [Phycisphaerales bacterium]